MASVDLEDKIELLRREYIFRELDDEQLAWVASLFHTRPYERDKLVFRQGRHPDYFYFVYSGKVRITMREDGQEQNINLFGRGDFFGEEGLIFHRPRPASARTVETTNLLRMKAAHFHHMMEVYPSVRKGLEATARSRQLAREKNFGFRGGDEVIYFVVRKHIFFLVLSLVLPTLMLVLSPVAIVIGLTMPTLFFRWLIVGSGMLMGVIGILWGVWKYLDWGNDYYIVTDQRVIWLEKVIALYESRREAPLDTILAVNVASSMIGRIVGYGNVNVRTFTGGILMRNAANPHEFASFVEGFKERALEISREEEAEAMDRALRDALVTRETPPEHRLSPPPEAPPPQRKPPPQPVQRRQPVPSLRQRLDHLFKVRYEQGGVITYRKHWFVLLGKVWLPLLLFLTLSLGTLTLLYWDYTGRFSLFSAFVIVAVALLFMIPVLIWLVYEYLDWSNDIYRLSTEQIFDIERKPLGREEKKTAPLESILSIEHEREHLIGVLLNYGNVVINVGETRFVFRGVFNPDQVHQDIADYREALNRKKREREAERERDRMVDWLVRFYEQTEEIEGEGSE